MKNKLVFIMLIAVSFIYLGVASAQNDKNVTFATESGIGIQFGGQVEMEFVDVEGEGGFSNQDLTFQKVKNRSPHMRIDKAVLSTKIFYSENLTYEIQFRFDDDDAKVDKHFATLTVPEFNTKFEIGKNRPMIKTSRRTEGYPLIGTAFWKGREYHVTSKTKMQLNEDINFNFGGSVAMKRPLDSDDAAEDKSFKMIVYGDYNQGKNGTFEYGVSGGFEAYGLYGQGWYYTGELIDNSDWRTQLSQTLADYDALGDETNRDHYWFGGRIGFEQWGLDTRAEYIKSQDGLLPRDGFYAESSYLVNTTDVLPFQSIRPLVRYGMLTVRDIRERLGETESWDRSMITLALLTSINDYLNLKIEYYLLDETTGGTTSEDESVKDDQLLFQFEFNF